MESFLTLAAEAIKKSKPRYDSIVDYLNGWGHGGAEGSTGGRR